MDHRYLESLARVVASKNSRRSAIAALAGAALFGGLSCESEADRNRQSRRRNRFCYPRIACVLGQNRKGEKCTFTGSTAFQGADLRFANFAEATSPASM